MAKTANKTLRFDPGVYEAFQLLTATLGQNVTDELEKYMSQRTGVKITRKKAAKFGGTGKSTMSVTCPFCEAVPHEKCRNKYTGEPVGRPHPQRIQAALEV